MITRTKTTMDTEGRAPGISVPWNAGLWCVLNLGAALSLGTAHLKFRAWCGTLGSSILSCFSSVLISSSRKSSQFLTQLEFPLSFFSALLWLYSYKSAYIHMCIYSYCQGEVSACTWFATLNHCVWIASLDFKLITY